MRKIKLVLAGIAIITATSCDHEYTCTCVYPDGNIGTTETEYETKDEDEARAECDKLHQAAQAQGGVCKLEDD